MKETLGFGVPVSGDPNYVPHHMIVSIPSDDSSQIQVTECFGTELVGRQPRVVHRASLDMPTWKKISAFMQRDFNRRLEQHGLATGSWQAGKNLVDRLLGKEVCALVWVLEKAEAWQVPSLAHRWAYQRPEERWAEFAARLQD